MPGLTEAIVTDWKTQQYHTRDLERQGLENEHIVKKEQLTNERSRNRNAFILGLLGLLVIGILGGLGKTVPAAIVGALEGFGGWAFWKQRAGFERGTE